MKRQGAVYAPNKSIESRLRYITCGSKSDHLFLNRGYHTIQQYKMAVWIIHHEWKKSNLNYKDIDAIRNITADRNEEYLVMNIRENSTTWIIDVRRIDENLTQLKRIEGYHQKLQLISPSNHWLFVRENPNKLYLYDIKGDDAKIAKEVSFGDNGNDPRFVFSEYAPISLRWLGQTHLVLGTVVDKDKTGALKIYRV